MCLCASCEYTDAFSGRADMFSDGSPNIKGFDNWPRGDTAGKRSSESAYRAHVAHLWDGIAKTIAFKPGQAPRFKITGTRQLDAGADRSYPTLADAKLGAAHYVKAFLAANGYAKEASPGYKSEPASPATPCKAPQHFPAQDRPHETVVSLPQSYRVQSSANDSEENMPAKFMTVAQAAESWGASQPRIRQWLADGRIRGAEKVGRDWLIPASAQRPRPAKPGELQAAARR